MLLVCYNIKYSLNLAELNEKNEGCKCRKSVHENFTIIRNKMRRDRSSHVWRRDW